MPTNDERREVAARLRALDVWEFDEGECIDQGDVENALGIINIDGAWCEAEGVMRLAGLIEPEERTCRAECFPPGHERGLHQVVCSECGALVFGPVMPGDDRGSMFRFCPSCGARVTEVEE